MRLPLALLCAALAFAPSADAFGASEHAAPAAPPAKEKHDPAATDKNDPSKKAAGGFVSPLAPFEAKFRAALQSGDLDAIPTIDDIRKAVKEGEGKTTVPPDQVENEVGRAKALAAALKAAFRLKAIGATSGASEKTLLPPVGEVVLLLGEPRMNAEEIVQAILKRAGKTDGESDDDKKTVDALRKGRIGIEHLADMAVLMSGRKDPASFKELLSLRVQPVREAMTWLSVFGPKEEEDPLLRRDLERVDRNLDETWNAAHRLLNPKDKEISPDESARRVEAARSLILESVKETSALFSRVAQAQLDKRAMREAVVAAMAGTPRARVSDLDFLKSLRVPSPVPARDKVIVPKLESVELPEGPRAKLQQSALAALSAMLPANDWVRGRLNQVEAKLRGEMPPELDGPRDFTTPDGKKLPLEEVARRALLQQCLDKPDLKGYDAGGELLTTAVKQRGHFEVAPQTFWERIRRGKLVFAEARHWQETTPRNVMMPGVGSMTVSYAGLADFDHFSQSLQQGFESPWDTVNVVLDATNLPLINTRASHELPAGGNFMTDFMVRTMNAVWTGGKRLGVIRGSAPDPRQYDASRRGLALAQTLRAKTSELKSFCKAVAAAY